MFSPPPTFSLLSRCVFAFWFHFLSTFIFSLSYSKRQCARAKHWHGDEFATERRSQQRNADPILLISDTMEGAALRIKARRLLMIPAQVIAFERRVHRTQRPWEVSSFLFGLKRPSIFPGEQQMRLKAARTRPDQRVGGGAATLTLQGRCLCLFSRAPQTGIKLSSASTLLLLCIGRC